MSVRHQAPPPGSPDAAHDRPLSAAPSAAPAPPLAAAPSAAPSAAPAQSPSAPPSAPLSAPLSAAPSSALPLCTTCGTQFGPQFGPPPGPPASCPICEDERQYVGPDGQRWTTLDELRDGRHNAFTPLEPGLTAIRTEPTFAIGQRAFLIEAEGGNILWDCVSLVDDASVAAVLARGPVRAIAISHPHFYSSMVEWARALGDVPVWVHEADRRWVMRPDPSIRTWSGAAHELGGGLTLVHVGGHFAGAQALVWAAGAGGAGALFAGDMPNVCADRRWVTYMRSYPNFIPLSGDEAARAVEALRPWPFDRLYGWAPGRTIERDAKGALERSLERHRRALRGEHDVVAAP